jgi:tetratricopeptide (TPR) repeat protein
VLSCDSAQQRKARRVLEQALALRPRCIEAVLALAELDNNEGHHDDAVKRLKEQLVHDVSNAEFIYVKLGEISMKDKPNEAIEHFRAALAINAYSESARAASRSCSAAASSQQQQQQ